jgi:hypothetical protein
MPITTRRIHDGLFLSLAVEFRPHGLHGGSICLYDCDDNTITCIVSNNYTGYSGGVYIYSGADNKISGKVSAIRRRPAAAAEYSQAAVRAIRSSPAVRIRRISREAGRLSRTTLTAYPNRKGAIRIEGMED